MRVIEIGPGNLPSAQNVWPDAQVDTVEADEKFDTTFHFDARYPPEELYGKYDALLASHVFEHIPFMESLEVLKRWARLVKVGGQVHILVPSGEWTAIELLKDPPSKVLQAQLHGAHTSIWDVHHATYTMRHLRAYFQMAGLAVTAANSSQYLIMVGEEGYPADQHYIKGIRLPDKEGET